MNGAPGVGKTATCRELQRLLDRSVWLDGDWCWMANPWIVTEETKKMVESNITYLLDRFLNCSEYRFVLLSWIFRSDDVFSHILDGLQATDFLLQKFTLTCEENAFLDRLELALEIEKWATKLNLIAKCLLQIDICQDGSKHGIYPSVEAIKEFFTEISTFTNVKIQGLMTIAPYVPPEETRIYFRRMGDLFEKVKRDISLPQNVNMEILSMGMSNDYLIALEEGSNCIRLGTAIFR